MNAEEQKFRRKYRLAALDLDGTLVNRQTEIHPADRAALRKAASGGVAIVLASGRMGAAIQPVFDQLGIDGPIIAYNGGMVLAGPACCRDRIFHQPVPAEIARSVVDFVYWFNRHAPADDRLHLNYYLNDKLYADQPCIWSERYHNQTGSIFHFVGDLRQFAGMTPTKMIVMTHPERRDTFHELLRYHLSDRVTLAKTMPEYHLEIMDAGVNKGTALLALGRHLGIAPEQMITFGDAANDIPMLELEGVFGVAMGNSTPQTIAAADWVAPPVEEAGVAAAIHRFLSAGCY